MKTMQFSVGLIGCGDVSKRYATAMDGAIKELRLRGTWDISQRTGADFAERYEIEFIPSFDDFLSHPFDLVCVCTPNNTHSMLTEECLKAGFNILVEHPMATVVADGERILRLADQYDRLVFVMRQRRFLTSVQLLRAALALGLLGKISCVKAMLIWNRSPKYFTRRVWRRRKENGGVVLNQASHFLDILLYLFGEPSELEGVIGHIRHNIPVEDAAIGTITFRSGITAEFAVTTGAPNGNNWARLVVTGTRGTIILSGEAWEIIEGTVKDALATLSSTLEEPLTGDHKGYIQRVAWRLSGKEVEIVDAREGMRAVRLIDRIYSNFKPDDASIRDSFLPMFYRVQS